MMESSPPPNDNDEKTNAHHDTVMYSDFQIPRIQRNSHLTSSSKQNNASQRGATNASQSHEHQNNPSLQALHELNLPQDVKRKLLQQQDALHESGHLEESQHTLHPSSSTNAGSSSPSFSSGNGNASKTTMANNDTNQSIARILKRLNSPYAVQKLHEMGLKQKKRPSKARHAAAAADDDDEHEELLKSYDLKAFSRSFDPEKLSTLNLAKQHQQHHPEELSHVHHSSAHNSQHNASHVDSSAPTPTLSHSSNSATFITETKHAHKRDPANTVMSILSNNPKQNDNRELSVDDVQFNSIDSPPVLIHYDKLVSIAVKNIQLPSGPFVEQLRALFQSRFTSQENRDIMHRLFWFCFCAFFETHKLKMLLKEDGLVEDLASKLRSFFWKTNPRLRNDFFEIYPHSVSYCIIKALKSHFPESKKNLFSKAFYVRVQQLIGELLTGIRFRESFVTKHMRLLFPQKKKALLSGPPKRDRGYYSSDDETSVEKTQEAQDQYDSMRQRKRRLQRRKTGLNGQNLNKKPTKQTLAEFIANPPHVEAETRALCDTADHVMYPPPVQDDPHRLGQQKKPSYLSQTRTRMNLQNMRRGSKSGLHLPNLKSGGSPPEKSRHSPPQLSKKSHSQQGKSQKLSKHVSGASISSVSPDGAKKLAAINDPRFVSTFQPDENYDIEAAKRRLAKRNPRAAFSNKVKVRLQFLANANATKERMIEERRKSNKAANRKDSPRLDTPELLDAMQEIRKKSKQLNSDSVAFGSANSGMASTMCMSPLLSMSTAPPMEFATPGKRRYLKLDQSNVSHPQFFFHPSDPKKKQHHIIRHHNLWTFPDSKLHFKYSLMRQKIQLESFDQVNTETEEEMQRIDEKNKQALSVIRHEEQQILADNTGEKLKDLCKMLIDRTIGNTKVDISDSQAAEKKAGIFGGDDSEIDRFRGTNLAVYALNHSEKLKDELGQFQQKLDSIVSRKLKGT